MKKKFIIFFIISTIIFTFIIFYKGLNKSGLYEPKSEIKNIPIFFAKSFFLEKEINSTEIFSENKYYLFNIWASWCIPCRTEHPFLFELSKEEKIEIIGLNYKDKKSNAKKFLNELGNPYKKILLDQDGTIGIEWGAIGVPETFLIYKNRIIMKFIGPLSQNSILEIKQAIE